uniref:Uncharacterized protein n=1 Tax=Cacopsylla melanoneura TaxID=428564 RepID=A0A8D8WDW6_9HEMI
MFPHELERRSPTSGFEVNRANHWKTKILKIVLQYINKPIWEPGASNHLVLYNLEVEGSNPVRNFPGRSVVVVPYRLDIRGMSLYETKSRTKHWCLNKIIK